MNSGINCYYSPMLMLGVGSIGGVISDDSSSSTEDEEEEEEEGKGSTIQDEHKV